MVRLWTQTWPLSAAGSGHHRGFMEQCRPLRSIWSQAAAQPTGTNIASGGRIDHGHASVWALVVAWVTHINTDMALVGSMNPDIMITSDGGTGHSHQYGAQWQHSSLRAPLLHLSHLPIEFSFAVMTLETVVGQTIPPLPHFFTQIVLHADIHCIHCRWTGLRFLVSEAP